MSKCPNCGNNEKTHAMLDCTSTYKVCIPVVECQECNTKFTPSKSVKSEEAQISASNITDEFEMKKAA